jgi:hypothetical protein
MARTTQQLMVAVVMTGLLGSARPVLAGSADAPGPSRVRSSSAPIAALIGRAVERSQTFRGLVETIDASDGIVYVEEGTCRGGVRACFVAVVESGPNRLLKVVVDTRKAEWDLMGSIGHELQHTIEVLNDLHLRNNFQMYFFYEGKGRSATSSSFETSAAIHAGESVRTEVRKYPRRIEGN